jgi:hypothetical protein
MIRTDAPRTRSSWPGRRTAILVIALTGLVAACDGHPPLGEPDATVRDDRILGEWGPDDGSDGGLRVVPFNDAEYLVVLTEKEETDYARAFFTRVGDAMFLNVESIEDARDDGEWEVYRVEFTGSDAARIRELERPDPEIPDFEGRRARIQARLEDPALYREEPILLRRVQAKAAR